MWRETCPTQRECLSPMLREAMGMQTIEAGVNSELNIVIAATIR
jgi:hypothetical protein